MVGEKTLNTPGIVYQDIQLSVRRRAPTTSLDGDQTAVAGAACCLHHKLQQWLPRPRF